MHDKDFAAATLLRLAYTHGAMDLRNPLTVQVWPSLGSVKVSSKVTDADCVQGRNEGEHVQQQTLWKDSHSVIVPP
eukprot:824766-Amphidinium_carterae.1